MLTSLDLFVNVKKFWIVIAASKSSENSRWFHHSELMTSVSLSWM